MKIRSPRLRLSMLLAVALVPTLGVALRAVADEPPAPAETPEKARKRVLAADSSAAGSGCTGE